MDRLVGQALAFLAVSCAAVSAALLPLFMRASRAWHSGASRAAKAFPKLAVRVRWLRGRAMRLPPPAVQLIAASTAVVLTLTALALPDRNHGRMLASVELALGGSGGSSGGAGTGADEILIEPPPTVASTRSTVSPPPAEAPTGQLASAVPQTEEPQQTQESAQTEDPAQTDQPAKAEAANLAGLDEIPADLLAKQPKGDGEAAPRKASFAAFSKTRENLPWKEVEPVAFKPMGPGEQHKAGSAPTPAVASAAIAVSSADIGKWMKGKATKIMGAERTKPLYHFMVWIEPPTAMQARVAGVSYDFSSPAVQPQSQASSDRESGFKINAAGLVCADEITVTLRFDDGRVETTHIDGCELFNKA